MTDDMMSPRTPLGREPTRARGRIRCAAPDGVGGRSLTGAAHGKRSSDRIDRRNGSRDRDRETAAGTVEPRMPKLTNGSYCRRLDTRDGREGTRRDGPRGVVRACQPVRSPKVLEVEFGQSRSFEVVRDVVDSGGAFIPQTDQGGNRRWPSLLAAVRCAGPVSGAVGESAGSA